MLKGFVLFDSMKLPDGVVINVLVILLILAALMKGKERCGVGGTQ